MVEIQNLSKKYGSINAINNLNFTVEPGEILGFLGPNGAGKTTTMNILTGYISASSGSVKVCGYDVLENPIEVKKRIGYLPEIPPLYFDMTVVEYLNFVSDLKLVNKKLRTTLLTDILEIVKITDVKKRLIKNLSKGYKQRVGLAQALIGNPKVLILDEPTVGLDPKQIIEIRNLIKSLGKKHTIILSSHILPEVSAICDRVIIINKGQIQAIDTPENLSKFFTSSIKLSVTIEGFKENVIPNIQSIEGVSLVSIVKEKDDNIINYLIETEKEIDIKKSLFYKMADAKTPILELKSLNVSLEDIFLQLTTEENNEQTHENSKDDLYDFKKKVFPDINNKMNAKENTEMDLDNELISLDKKLFHVKKESTPDNSQLNNDFENNDINKNDFENSNVDNNNLEKKEVNNNDNNI